jgi:hypothetical protein
VIEVQIAREIVTTLLMVASVIVWPPVTTGPFWLMAALYALVSIFFDDETPRGVPGIELLERN